MARSSTTYLDLTREDFIVNGSLDEVAACGHFLGKSLREAERLFLDNALFYQEDLYYMGPRAFCVYFEAFVTYLESPASEGSSDGVNTFAGMLEFRLEHARTGIEATFPRLSQCCHYILRHWDRYDVSESIYGNLRERVRELCLRLDSA